MKCSRLLIIALASTPLAFAGFSDWSIRKIPGVSHVCALVAKGYNWTTSTRAVASPVGVVQGAWHWTAETRVGRWTEAATRWFATSRVNQGIAWVSQKTPTLLVEAAALVAAAKASEYAYDRYSAQPKK